MTRASVSEHLPFKAASPPAFWIWSQEGVHLRSGLSPSASTFETRLFRKTIFVDEVPRLFRVAISADGRYSFFFNGQHIGRGPAKGDVRHQFYETYDLTEWMRPGKNVLAVRVIDYSAVECNPPLLGAPASVMVHKGGLAFDGWLEGTATSRLVSDATWRVWKENSLEFAPDEKAPGGFVGYFERWHVRDAELDWQEPDYDDQSWAQATVLYPTERIEDRRDSVAPYGLIAAIVQPCYEGREQNFADIFLPGGAIAPENVRAWGTGPGRLRCEAGQSFRAILDAGKLETGFPVLALHGGADARITLTYAEALRLSADVPSPFSLRPEGDLASVANDSPAGNVVWSFDRRGVVSGFRDVILGDGRSCQFEPTHWRTFRYLMVEIEGGSEPVELEAVTFRPWAYPLKIVSDVETSREVDRKIWDISVRTLQLCSHETFEDCPYYEQLQYAGDSLITSRLALYLTGKGDLTRQALYHFAWSLTPEGIIASRYPCTISQVIPSWGLHWISMLHDYVLLSGDREIARELLRVAESILSWFRRYADTGGLPSLLPFWNCVDWTPGWQRGQPPGWDAGATCVISCQVVQALREVSRLYQWCGNDGKGELLQREAHRIAGEIERRFWAEKIGCYRDAETFPDSSILANAWAVCAGIVPEGKKARVAERLLQWSPANVSYFGMFWVFRALRGLKVDQWWLHLRPWEKLVDLGLTTWPEDTAFWRSMCHAWSAHPIIEYIEGVVGLRVEAPGWSEVSLCPNLGPLKKTSFRLCTPLGEIRGDFRQEEAGFRFKITKPSAMRLCIVYGAKVIVFPLGEDLASGLISLVSEQTVNRMEVG